ncbi:CLOCK-interacting pacemaker isoform X2 [Ahaetulla prasina]|uniref:CLOCK-interacting pacemaker isoform X2 n=1 Tax=Ahaetulla prasina TaxID=499056 RepID=UPI002647D74C|nr:CLOCK-interacting pacemaker isoform X2 [Ahaetulla prasina]
MLSLYIKEKIRSSRTERGTGMPFNEPFSPPSWPAHHKRSPLARPGSKWGGHVGQPEKIERDTHNGPPNPSCPVSEGEKDSGFSDGSSECLSAIEQTDTEDPASPPLSPGPAKSQKAKRGLLGGTFPGGLTPLYLIKNVILKQTLGVPPMTPFLAWSKQHPLESAHSSAAHLLLLQEPMVPLKPMLPSQKPSDKEICFPTHSAYPRIATHLGWQGKEAPSPVAEPSRHKHFYMGEAWASPEAPTAKDSREKPAEELPAGPQTSVLVCPEAPAQPTLSCAGLPPAGDRTTVKGARRLGGHSLVRQRRLQSTVEILRRSGLLGITLRTKELLRQNSRTQQELAQLREEAQLLCEAIRSSDSRAWARLQDAIGCSAAPCPSSKGGGAQIHI